ncbi:MAG: energy transducer TonB [Bacteroidaceae bacterium]|nr:energy transducer TonB [Bacteroidaceae bacterium]
MRLYIVILLVLLFSASLLAQTKKEDKKEDIIVMPQYPGGHEKMIEYLFVETDYPAEAYEKKETGEVLVGFTVEADGYISMAQVLKGVSPSLDAEAVRVVKSMPKWIPGTRNGRPVRAELSIPINFKLILKNNYYNAKALENGITKSTAREKRRAAKWWSGE